MEKVSSHLVRCLIVYEQVTEELVVIGFDTHAAYVVASSTYCLCPLESCPGQCQSMNLFNAAWLWPSLPDHLALHVR